MGSMQNQATTQHTKGIPPGERLLVAAAKVGCDEAFTKLVERYHRAILNYLIRQTGDKELAADLTQETFLDAFRHLDRIGEDRPFVAWLYRIARYNLLHERRRQRIRAHISLDLLISQTGEARWVLHQPDETTILHEHELIQQALSTLNATLRRPLLLQSMHGYTSQEIAQILEISWDAARQRIARAKAQFRQFYQRTDPLAVETRWQRLRG